MICSAASYAAASPNPGSMSALVLLTVLQPPSAAHAATVMIRRLEDMAVILLEAVGLLGLSHSAPGGPRKPRTDDPRRDEGRRRRRHARVGAAVQQQIRLVRRDDAV